MTQAITFPHQNTPTQSSSLTIRKSSCQSSNIFSIQENSPPPSGSFGFDPNQFALGPGILPKYQLAPFQELFPHCCNSEQEEITSQNSKNQSQLPHNFSVLEMVMKQPLKMEDLNNYKVNSLRQRRTRDQKMKNSKHSVITLSTSSLQARQEYGIKGEINCQPQAHKLQYKDDVTITYKISYRLQHKFSLKFKYIELQVDPYITVEQFYLKLLKHVYRAACFFVHKDIFIEKERDLVPLISMGQLFTNKMNFLQIRDIMTKKSVIEKPILIKKKNTPDIGLSILQSIHNKRDECKSTKQAATERIIV